MRQADSRAFSARSIPWITLHKLDSLLDDSVIANATDVSTQVEQAGISQLDAATTACSALLSAAASIPTKLTINSTVRLRSGVQMPMFGLGTCLHDARAQTNECAAACTAAVDAGYRMIDTATTYGNERDVGLALRGRPHIFIVTKLDPKDHGADRTAAAIDASIAMLGKIDLYLLHNPDGGG